MLREDYSSHAKRIVKRTKLMSNAIVLFRNSDEETWVPFRTVVFDTRRTTDETVQCGPYEVQLQHAVQAGHTLILTHGDTRVVLWPTGGNEPDAAAPETKFDLPVVGHYDVVGPEGQTHRFYHAQHRYERM